MEIFLPHKFHIILFSHSKQQKCYKTLLVIFNNIKHSTSRSGSKIKHSFEQNGSKRKLFVQHACSKLDLSHKVIVDIFQVQTATFFCIHLKDVEGLTLTKCYIASRFTKICYVMMNEYCRTLAIDPLLIVNFIAPTIIKIGEISTFSLKRLFDLQIVNCMIWTLF